MLLHTIDYCRRWYVKILKSMLIQHACLETTTCMLLWCASDGRHKSCWVSVLPSSFHHNLLACTVCIHTRLRLVDPFHATSLEKGMASAMESGVVIEVSNLQSVQKAVIGSWWLGGTIGDLCCNVRLCFTAAAAHKATVQPSLKYVNTGRVYSAQLIMQEYNINLQNELCTFIDNTNRLLAVLLPCYWTHQVKLHTCWGADSTAGKCFGRTRCGKDHKAQTKVMAAWGLGDCHIYVEWPSSIGSQVRTCNHRCVVKKAWRPCVKWSLQGCVMSWLCELRCLVLFKDRKPDRPLIEKMYRRAAQVEPRT